MSSTNFGDKLPISLWAGAGCAPVAWLAGAAGTDPSARTRAPYYASLTFPIQPVFLPSSRSTTAMSDIAEFGAATCQEELLRIYRFTDGGNSYEPTPERPIIPASGVFHRRVRLD